MMNFHQLSGLLQADTQPWRTLRTVPENMTLKVVELARKIACQEEVKIGASEEIGLQYFIGILVSYWRP